MRHQALNDIQKRRRHRQKLDPNEIAIGFGTSADVTYARIGNRGLTVEHEAHRLNGLDRKRLTRLDQRAMMREVVYASRFSGIERSPKRTKYLVPNMGPSIAWRTHHDTRLSIVCVGPLQGSRHSGVTRHREQYANTAGNTRALVRYCADYGLAME